MTHLELQYSPPPSAAQDPFLIFLHIHKTGGMTLQRMLRRRYGPGLLGRAARAARFLASPGAHPRLKESFLATCPRDRFVAGHFCYGAHELLPTPSTYVTMLRRPVERLVSLYHHSRLQPAAFYGAQARRFTLEQFLLDCRLMELDNGQLRFILGESDDLFINRTPFGHCTAAMLDRAKDHIDRHFSVVGLLERFDESVLLMRHKLRWSNAYYLRVNEGRAPGAAPLSPDLYQEVARRNHLDLQLYDHARQRLDLEIDRLGPPFQEELRRFRARNRLFNRALSPLYDPYDRMKAALKKALRNARGKIRAPGATPAATRHSL